jgi:Ulp1 family protease
MVEKHGANVGPASCDWRSILALAPGAWFNDTLIDAIPGLMASTVDSRAFLFSSFLYRAHIENRDFEGANRWIKNASRDRSRWLFGICQGAHWVAVEINWESAEIRYYDPKGQTPWSGTLEV